MLGEFLDGPVVRSTDFISGQGIKIQQASQRCQKKKICCWGKSCHECPIEDNSIKPCCLVAKLCPALLWQPQRSPPGSSVHGVSQTRVLEWVAIAFSRGCSRPRDQTQVSRISGRFFTTEPPGKPHRIVWERQSPNSKERLMMQTLCYAV